MGGRDRTLAPGHLSMRELCLLIFPSHSTEHELALGAFSYNDLVFKLHMQRRCLEESSVPNLARHQLQHLIDVAASAAAQLESDRRQLKIFPDDATVALHDAFSFVSEGRLFFSATYASGLPSSQYHRFGKGDGPAVEEVPTPSFPEQRAILGLPPPVEASKKVVG